MDGENTSRLSNDGNPGSAAPDSIESFCRALVLSAIDNAVSKINGIPRSSRSSSMVTDREATTDSDSDTVGSNGGSTGSGGIRPPTIRQHNQQRLREANGDNGRSMVFTRFGGKRFVGSGSTSSPGNDGYRASQAAVVTATVGGNESNKGVSAGYPDSGELLPCLGRLVVEREHGQHVVGRLADLPIPRGAVASRWWHRGGWRKAQRCLG